MKGIQNEFDFVLEFNNKKIKELNPIMRDLVNDLYGNINEDLIIKSWRNHYKQKSDIFIKINNIIKGISIKEGNHNSVHVEPISTFIHFLIENHIPQDILEKYLKYHYADGTINGSGKNRIDSSEYKMLHKDEIDIINKYFSNKAILYKAIERFVLQGTNYKYKIDALICGTPNDFVWINQNQIVEILMNNEKYNSSGVHFSKLFCQPQNRNLNFNDKYEKKRFCVQIKWYSLYDDIILHYAGVK